MDCSICTSSYDEKDHKPFSLTPCGHCFCLKCINSLTNQTCPKCRNSIQSKIVNFAVMDILNGIARPKSWSKRSNSIRESKVFQTLDNILSETDELKKDLKSTYEKRVTEIQTGVNKLKEAIQMETEEKISRLLHDNQIIMSRIDSICSNGIEKLNKLSNSQQIEMNLREFEQKFSSFNLNELIENSSKLKDEVNQRIKDLNEFKLKFSIGLNPMYLGENQKEGEIGKYKILKNIAELNSEAKQECKIERKNNSYQVSLII